MSEPKAPTLPRILPTGGQQTQVRAREDRLARLLWRTLPFVKDSREGDPAGKLNWGLIREIERELAEPGRQGELIDGEVRS